MGEREGGEMAKEEGEGKGGEGKKRGAGEGPRRAPRERAPREVGGRERPNLWAGLSSVPSTSRKSLSTIQRFPGCLPVLPSAVRGVTALTLAASSARPCAVQPARNRGPDAFRLNQRVVALDGRPPAQPEAR